MQRVSEILADFYLSKMTVSYYRKQLDADKAFNLKYGRLYKNRCVYRP